MKRRVRLLGGAALTAAAACQLYSYGEGAAPPPLDLTFEVPANQDGGVDAGGDARPGCSITPCARHLAAGADHACLVSSAGELWCWGSNASGELGRPADWVGAASAIAPVANPKPTLVPALATFVTTAAGAGGVSGGVPAFTCAATGDAGLQCWGANAVGQLGRGVRADADVVDTRPASLGFSATSVSLGASHACAITANGNVACWGDDSSLQLGHAPSTSAAIDAGDPRPALVSLPAGAHATAVSAGPTYTCAVVDERVWCWGTGAQYQLGRGTAVTVDAVPAPTIDFGPVQDVAAGEKHVCALTTGARVFCWGADDVGQLGRGSVDGGGTPTWQPAQVQFGDSVPMLFRQITVGGSFGCALNRDTGEVWCWGSNADGELGGPPAAVRRGAFPFSALGLRVPVPFVPVREIRAGATFVCAVVDGGLVACWGANDRGQLGRVTIDAGLSFVPQPVDLP